ncbi:MAG TPA: hypothetical protein VGM44_18410 [Polyangiaceae bacterium]|jgi:hypothetical protein
MGVHSGLSACVGLILFAAGCSSASAGPSAAIRPTSDGSAGSSAVGSGAGSGGSGDPGSINTGDSGGSAGSLTNPNDACATTSAAATLIKQPVDIILVLDNSGSMADELQAVEDNININFANILNQSGVDYRVILLSRHRRDVRAASGESSTSICVSAPLSGLAMCPGPVPVNSERFYHYSIKIESTDSLDQILATYNARDEKFDLTEVGWQEWLRPGAKKVFLEMTDDNAALDVDTFIQRLQALTPANFGTDPMHPDFVFHSITGIQQKTPPTDPYQPDEPIQMGKCSGGGDSVANAGTSYQDLSKRTGGLRFPICEFASYDTVFSTIANDVVVKAQLACDFDIPPPPAGQDLDLSKVAVQYTAGGSAMPTQFGQAQTAADCEAGAFYIENNHIYLCPDTCTTVKADSDAKVDVLFTCQSTIIVK